MRTTLNNTQVLKTLTSHVDSQAKCKTRCWAGRIRGNFNDQPDGFRGPKAQMGSSTRNSFLLSALPFRLRVLQNLFHHTLYDIQNTILKIYFTFS